jgi:hypothetical protein
MCSQVPLEVLIKVTLKHHDFWDVTPSMLIVIDVSKDSSTNIQNVQNYYEPHSVTSSLLGLTVPENVDATILRNIDSYLPQRNIPGDLKLHPTHLTGFSITHYESNKLHDLKARTSPNHRHS